ncbi:MAG: PAS domain S-box protein [Thermoanaerobaculaceae bacterium]|nr:PAS domain S-box protein [Thermoanaerobaculaceae bacterium]
MGVCILAGSLAWWAAGQGLHPLADALLAVQLLVLAGLGAALWYRRHVRMLLAPLRDNWSLGSLIDAIPDGMFLLDKAGVIYAANESAARSFAGTKEALIGRNIRDLGVFGAAANLSGVAFGRQVETPAPYEFEHDGMWFEVGFGPVRDAQGAVAGLAVLSRDVTAQRRAAATLQESQRTFAAAFENAPIGMSLVSPGMSFLRVNHALEAILGRSEAELLAIPPVELIHPDDLQRASEIVAKGAMFDSPTAEFHGRYKHANGEYFPAQVNASVVRSADGRPNYYVAQVQDLTERQKAEQELIEAQKVQTVGRLAAGIAHDFNNLLQAMLLQIQLLGSGVLGAEAAALATAEIEDQVHRGKSLVRQLLLFARRDTARPEQLDLNELVASASRMLGRLVPANIAFSQQLGPGPLYVDGDRNQLEQVLVNLVVNAAHAMPDGGALVIRTGREDEDSTFLSVQDTGHGIPKEIRDRIFEPFFTTKPAEIGTGLGLSVVHSIVARHSGRLDLESEVGRGTTFKIVLPALRSPRVAAAATERPIVPPLLLPTQSAGERILVVEDEAGARDALRQILQALGYSVTAAASGEEAVLLPMPTPPRLLLSDLMLPGIRGTELAARLKRRWPDLRIILMSGYLPDDTMRQDVESGKVQFLQKPFGVAALAAEVRAALPDGS